MLASLLSFLPGFLAEGSTRVVHCHKDLLQAQKVILDKQKSLSRELKLSLKEKANISGCQLVGLDGGVKATSKYVFSMKELEDLINSMPMRKAELRLKSQ